MVYYNRGNIYRILKDYKLALEDFTEAIRIDPHYHKAYLSRGFTYINLK